MINCLAFTYKFIKNVKDTERTFSKLFAPESGCLFRKYYFYLRPSAGRNTTVRLKVNIDKKSLLAQFEWLNLK